MAYPATCDFDDQLRGVSLFELFPIWCVDLEIGHYTVVFFRCAGYFCEFLALVLDGQ